MIKVQYDLNLTPAERLKNAGLRKAIRIAVNRASRIVKDSTISHANAIKRYGFIAKSIRIRVKVYKEFRYVSIIGTSTKFTRTKGKFKRGPNKGKPRKITPARYAHLVEGGTQRSKAKPWLAPAKDDSAAAYFQEVALQVKREIELELARAK